MLKSTVIDSEGNFIFEGRTNYARMVGRGKKRFFLVDSQYNPELNLPPLDHFLQVTAYRVLTIRVLDNFSSEESITNPYHRLLTPEPSILFYGHHPISIVQPGGAVVAARSDAAFAVESGNDEEEWADVELAATQTEILNISVDKHSLELARDQLEVENILTIKEAMTQTGSRVRVAGMRLGWIHPFAEHGTKLQRLILEDLEASVAVVIADELYRRNREVLSSRGVIGVEGVMNVSSRHSLLRAERFWKVGWNRGIKTKGCPYLNRRTSVPGRLIMRRLARFLKPSRIRKPLDNQ